MGKAQELFDSMPEMTVVSWTILMSGYAKHGPTSFALVLFMDMLMGFGDSGLGGKWRILIMGEKFMCN
ncbi:Pentatricopeptide repeat [Dillenia turbinata]|uniref:Pentatricopeptide repeat n=1 Tax=Dillenia turbinata TaxID=194707 RepID=A0AAN8Z6D0_9MAGN